MTKANHVTDQYIDGQLKRSTECSVRVEDKVLFSVDIGGH